MTSLTQYYTATTLDGFIADPDRSLEWLFTGMQSGALGWAGVVNGRDFWTVREPAQAPLRFAA